MSYAKAMKHWKNPRKHKKCQPILMGFVNPNPAYPTLGKAWFQPGMDAEREAYIKEWHRQRGHICSHCDEKENLVPYPGMNWKHNYKLCKSCSLIVELKKYENTIEYELEELGKIIDNGRLKIRVAKTKDRINQLLTQYIEIGGTKMFNFPRISDEQMMLIIQQG